MIRKQIKYELQMYFTGSSFVMPVIFIAAYLCCFYSIKPMAVVSGYLVASAFAFLLMTWVGMSVAQRENAVMEQILYLKMDKAWKYYVGKALFLVILSVFVSLICTIVPVIHNQINGGTIFNRAVVISDVINAFLLITGCGMCGAALGNLLHTRVLYDRKLAIVLTVILAVLCICETAITEDLPVCKLVMWVLPQINLPQCMYGNAEYFNTIQSIGIFAILSVYAAVYFTGKSIVCHRHRF